MPKITIIGAGGYVFPLTVIRDVLSFPSLQDSEIRLMDINADNLDRTYQHAQNLVDGHDLPAKVMATTDLRESLDGTDFVVITWQVGGIEAYRYDVRFRASMGSISPWAIRWGPAASSADCARLRPPIR